MGNPCGQRWVRLSAVRDLVRGSEVRLAATAILTELETCISGYRPTAEHNDAVWKSFQQKTDTVPWLKAHRDWVEENSWGFGDRAFHYMWYLLLRDDVLNRTSPQLLEIGVYKGQVISLWALIAQHVGRPAAITGVSPFEGHQARFAGNNLLHRCAQLISRRYREDVRSANFYADAGYRTAVQRIFDEFGLASANLTLLTGYSQDESVRVQLAGRCFELIYVDGGHRYEEVIQDLNSYAPLVGPGGYLVVDDASCDLPGTAFWKGHESVSRAVADWGAPGFVNVFNVGHNRVYRRSS